MSGCLRDCTIPGEDTMSRVGAITSHIRLSIFSQLLFTVFTPSFGTCHMRNHPFSYTAAEGQTTICSGLCFWRTQIDCGGLHSNLISRSRFRLEGQQWRRNLFKDFSLLGSAAGMCFLGIEETKSKYSQPCP